jgi:hypothetical protein
MNPTDQVWREDIEEQYDLAKNSAKTLNEYMRVMAIQDAPPDLIERLRKARDLYAEIADELGPILCRFPE